MNKWMSWGVKTHYFWFNTHMDPYETISIIECKDFECCRIPLLPDLDAACRISFCHPTYLVVYSAIQAIFFLKLVHKARTSFLKVG